MNAESQSAQITRVTLVGAVVNVLLAGAKLSVGFLVGSPALVADGAHSFSDLTTDAFVLAGTRFARRPPDESHTYGHGKYETMAALLVGAALVGVGAYLAWGAGLSLYRREHIFAGYPVLAVAAVSIGSKEWMYQATQRVARLVGSAAVSANAWHHRSDALSSVAVVIGAVCGLFGLGHGDQVAAIVVGAMIGMVGARIVFTALVDFTERSIPERERRAIARAVEGVPGVKGWHRLRTRMVGREVFMDVHVLVDARLSVVEAHEIATAVERKVRGSLARPVNLVVHYEPTRDSVSTVGHGDVAGGRR
ncbi:MAG: cation transporter [Gemmatimonadetes bacterium]|nr:cation transporter [Gemmatimonadota bacterium]